jgi:thioredoxin 2
MQIVCAHCGTKNRVVEERLSQGPRCGQCGEPLTAAQPVEMPGERFEKYVTGTEQPIVVDFWAEWCGPCKMMAPVFAEAARQRPHVRFLKVDTDRAQDLAQRYGIRGIPTMIVFRGGREAARVSGAMPAGQLLAWLDRELAKAA